MNLQKLNPWNWFSHEDKERNAPVQVPVMRNEAMSSGNQFSHSSSLMRLHNEMDRLFDDMWNRFSGVSSLSDIGPGLAIENNSDAFFRPLIDVSGTDHGYQISLDVPGLDRNDINIEVDGDRLVIKGRKEATKETGDKHFYRVERNFGAFQRTLDLPRDANVDDLTARLKDGVLQLEIPRRELPSENVKRISISS